MLRLNLVGVHEVIHEFLDGLPAVLCLQVDHIDIWPEEVIRKLVPKIARGLLGRSWRTASRSGLRLRSLVWSRITHWVRSWLDDVERSHDRDDMLGIA